MHESSVVTVQLAKRHALNAYTHGEFVTRCGRFLQRYSDQATQKYGHRIEEYGDFMQHKAQEGLMYIQLLEMQGLYSKDLHEQAVQAHVDATKAHVQAIKLYTQVVRRRLKAIEKPDSLY